MTEIFDKLVWDVRAEILIDEDMGPQYRSPWLSQTAYELRLREAIAYAQLMSWGDATLHHVKSTFRPVYLFKSECGHSEDSFEAILDSLEMNPLTNDGKYRIKFEWGTGESSVVSYDTLEEYDHAWLAVLQRGWDEFAEPSYPVQKSKNPRDWCRLDVGESYLPKQP